MCVQGIEKGCSAVRNPCYPSLNPPLFKRLPCIRYCGRVLLLLELGQRSQFLRDLYVLGISVRSFSSCASLLYSCLRDREQLRSRDFALREPYALCWCQADSTWVQYV